MAKIITSKNFEDEKAMRGDGRFKSIDRYLKNDPVVLEYDKLKQSGNKYLRDDMWTEAARRGEISDLVALLNKNADSGFNNKYISKMEDKGYDVNYEGYKLALMTPYLDDQDTIEWKDEETGHVFGNFTQKGWAERNLDYYMQGYDAKMVEEQKASKNIIQKGAALIHSGLNRTLAGISGFLQDVYNLGEGFFNMIFNWSNDETAEDRYLYAFANDEDFAHNPLAAAQQAFKTMAFEVERKYLSITNAVDAYNAGYYFDGNEKNIFDRINSSIGVDAAGSHSSDWGRWWVNGIESIGYMLPSMLIPVKGVSSILGKAGLSEKAAIGVVKGIKQGAFYSGIFSGNIKDTVQRAEMNGVSYKDLNAGIVVANAGLKAGAQLLVEKALGLVMGFSGLDKLMGVGSKSTSKIISSTTSKISRGLSKAPSVVKVIGRTGKDMFKEGLEEVCQNLSDNLIDYIFGGDYQRRAEEEFTWQNMIDAFVVGSLISGVTSVVSGIQYVPKKNREIGVNEKGQAYRMGVFQTIDFRESINQLAEWNSVLDDPNASDASKADAALKLNVAMDKIGSIMSAIGLKRTMEAHRLLVEALDTKDKKDRAKAKEVLENSRDYAKRLYSEFISRHASAREKFLSAEKENKLIAAAEKKKRKFAELGITQFETILTPENAKRAKLEQDIDESSTDKLIPTIKNLGVEMIVGVDGNVVTRSDQVLFVDNNLIKRGDIESIIQGDAYDTVLESVSKKLTKRQKKMILDSYTSIVPKSYNATEEDAITALLFDANFYTKMLILSKERRYSNESIELLATLEEELTSNLSRMQSNKLISLQAMNIVMGKALKTLRRGLVTFATQYSLIDLDKISNKVLPPELKDEIRNHQNVIFTESINAIEEVVRKSESLPSILDYKPKKNLMENSNRQAKSVEELLEEFDREIDEIAVYDKKIDKNKIKDAIRSSNPNDRLDAIMSLRTLTQKSADRVYLPIDPASNELKYISRDVFDKFEIAITDIMILSSNELFSKMSDFGKDYIASLGYEFDAIGITAAINNYLVDSTNNRYGLFLGGDIVKIYSAEDLFGSKEEALDKIYNLIIKKFNKDIKLSELFNNVYLPKFLSNTTIRFDDLSLEAFLSNTIMLGGYIPEKNSIIIDIDHVRKLRDYSNMTDIELMLSLIGHYNTTFSDNISDKARELNEVRKNKIINILTNSGVKIVRNHYNGIDIESGIQIKSDPNIVLNFRKYKKEAIEILDNGQKLNIVDSIFTNILPTILHETTHATHNAFETSYIGRYTTQIFGLSAFGGSKEFKFMSDDLKNYIKDNFPNYYKLLDGKTDYMLYSMLFGELTAETNEYYRRFSGLGFRVKRVLSSSGLAYKIVSPDGKKSWDIKMNFGNTKKLTSSREEASNTSNRQTVSAREELPVDSKISKKNYDNRRVTITQKLARDTNLKYFYNKGISTKIDVGIAKFVKSTTSEFDKLPKFIQERIKSGTLTKYDIAYYVQTANNINDYTFKSIAKYVYDNEALSLLTFSQAKKLLELSVNISTMYMFDKNNSINNENLSFEQILGYTDLTQKYVDRITNYPKSDKDKKAKKEYEKAYKNAQSILVEGADKKGGMMEAIPDPLQMMGLMFRHYDGTIKSIHKINNLGKLIVARQANLGEGDDNLIETTVAAGLDGSAISGSSVSDSDYSEESENPNSGKKKSSDTVWNWVDKKRTSEINYDEDTQDALNDIGSDEKVELLKDYAAYVMSKKIEKMSKDEKLAKAKAIQAQFAKLANQIENMTEEQLNDAYLKAISVEAYLQDRRLSFISKDELDYKKRVEGLKMSRTEQGLKTIKKRQVRNKLSLIRTRLMGSKVLYNSLPENVKKYFDPNAKYKYDTDFSKYSLQELNSALIELTSAADMLVKKVRAYSKAQEKRDLDYAKTLSELVDRLRKNKDKISKSIVSDYDSSTKKSNTYKMVGRDFEFYSNSEPNDLVKKALDTAWSDKRMSIVKDLNSNSEEIVANSKVFFENIGEYIMDSHPEELADAAEWFMQAEMKKINSDTMEIEENYKMFDSIRMYFLGLMYQESAPGRPFDYAIDQQLRNKIDKFMRISLTEGGTRLSIYKNLLKRVRPFEYIVNARIEVGNVPLTENEREELVEALEKGSSDDLIAVQERILSRIKTVLPNGISLPKQILTFRYLSMLSSPLTWLRNNVSNVTVTKIHKWSDSIGEKVFSSKKTDGQLRLTGQASTEASNFVNEHFVQNNMYEALVGEVSKYDLEQFGKKMKYGKMTKEDIMSDLVFRNMYGQYYSEGTFNTSIMKSFHKFIVKRMSDSKYIKRTAISYFEKILTERRYDLSKNEVTDDIMKDFAISVSMALKDYMRSPNMFTKLDQYISEKSQAGYAVYKLILPFASAGLNWFMEAIKTSPVGLARGIFRLATLEKQIAKAEAAYAEGKSTIPPELVEYYARREVGQGVIGTISLILGSMLAAAGLIKLEDDDYGKPKIVLFNKLKVDISSIFGTSSLLAGAAFVTGIKDKKPKDGEMNFKSFFDMFSEAMNRAGEVALDGLPFIQLIEMDMYSNGKWNIGLDTLESIALSFIPNFLAWIAGGTYSGVLDKQTIFGRLAAKIPFLGPVLNEKKVNPYTGEEGTWWDAAGRVIPYFSLDLASENEIKSKQLGLKKDQLKGKYEINGEKFELDAKMRNEINKLYGKMNSDDLEQFYANKMRVKLKIDNKYVYKTYSQMTDEERTKAVQGIMNANANLAKIAAWTMSGHKYYASASVYSELKRKGITSNLYVGSQGFVK